MSHAVSPNPAEGLVAEGRAGVGSRQFIGLLITQCLGAMNDNMFRWLAVNLAIYRMGKQFEGTALALGAAMLVLPFIVFAAPAGFLADRFGKPRVITGTKIAEVLIMSIGALSIWLGNVPLMFVVVLLMGTQSALFGPAKLGILPELLRPQALPTANGIANLGTMVAIIGGTLAGNALYDITGPDGMAPVTLPLLGVTVPGILISGGALVGVAGIGWLASLLIGSIPAADPQRKFRLIHIVGETWRDLRLLAESPARFRVALGAAYFWALGCLSQMNIYTYAENELGIHDNKTQIGILLVILAVGVSIGSIFAGITSRGRVELGMVPIAALGLALSAMALIFTTESYTATAIVLFLLGFTGGLYDVPLMAYMQRNTADNILGSVFAAYNFMSFSGMLLTTAIFMLLNDTLQISPSIIFLFAGLMTIPVAFFIFSLVPDATLRFFVWIISLFIYRVRVYGQENIPEKGGALLVCNHVSWADGVLLLLNCPRNIRMIAYSENLKGWGIRWMAKIMRAIPINSAEGPKAMLRSLQDARQALLDGELVCIFAEGSITRTGQLLPFQRGMMRIIEGTNCPVIPVCLDELWGSIFSFSGGKFFWKCPRRVPYPVTLIYGKPVYHPESAPQIRQLVEELQVEAAEKRKHRRRVLPRQFIRKCRQFFGRSKIADSTGQNLTGGQLLLRSLILRRVLRREVLAPDEQMVGVLLPPSVGGAITNTALTLLRRVPVNLNYTLSSDDLNSHVAACQMRHVLTSRRFQEKVNIELDVPFFFLEDLKNRVTLLDKIVAAIQTYLVPAFILDRLLGLTRIQPDDPMTIIFTSGSTGEPKGVVLSYYNIASNIDAIDHLFQLEKSDVLLGVLPFFHSFGFTGTLWTVLALNPKGVYHFNPLDARVVGKLAQEHKVTILMATPTFLRTYVKRCDKEQFAHLDLAVCGAEKMPAELAEAFEEKFGIRPSEGYGTTELSPLACVNVPDHRSASFTQVGTKEGSVGRPVPGVTAKVVDPDTGEPVGVDQPGLLLIRGPNVMQGYLNRPDKTAEVIRDGWYVTGDIAKIDADGFVQITDRLSRFSKIGGEMVPHLKIEELLTKILAHPEDEGPELRAVVTSVPDEKKGERLVVLHKPLEKPVDQVVRELSEAGLPNLWVPSPDSFIEVDEIPVLGTGKLDLKGLKNMALSRMTVRA